MSRRGIRTCGEGKENAPFSSVGEPRELFCSSPGGPRFDSWCGAFSTLLEFLDAQSLWKGVGIEELQYSGNFFWDSAKAFLLAEGAKARSALENIGGRDVAEVPVAAEREREEALLGGGGVGANELGNALWSSGRKQRERELAGSRRSHLERAAAYKGNIPATRSAAKSPGSGARNFSGISIGRSADVSRGGKGAERHARSFFLTQNPLKIFVP